MTRGWTWLVGLALIGGCTRPPVTSDSLGESSETSAGPGDGDGEPGDGDGDGDPTGDGDGDGDPTGDGDGDPTGDGDGDGDPTGDGDGEPSPCEPWQTECPDGACRGANDDFPCCGHGGACAEGCEPQDAVDPAPVVCEDPIGFAWTGEVCRALCACEGADCGALFDTPKACLEAHDGLCGPFDFSTCPFDQLYGPTLVEGSTPLGPVSYAAGSFGLAYGKGPGTPGLVLRLGYTTLELGNYVSYFWSSDEVSEEVLMISGVAELGVQDVEVRIAGVWNQVAFGTLTITGLSIEGGDPAAHTLEATLELDAAPWVLSGPIAIYGCERLDVYAP